MITLLAVEKDKLGNDINLRHTETLSMSPVYSFFLRQMADLIDHGLNLPMTSWNDNHCGAIYAEQDGMILGHIVYSTEHVDTKGYLWITLSAVDDGYRGRGIYNLMHTHLESLAQKLRCNAIASHVHVDNAVRLKSCEQVGMKPVFYFMAKKI